MLRRCLINTAKVAIFPFSLLDADNVKGTETEQKADVSVVKNETGWDRVKRMYQADEFGNLTQEANTILQVGAMSTFVGALYGGVMSSRTAYMDFIKNNQATVFEHHYDAKKKLQDKVTISFGKGAFKWAWRLTLFSTAFVGISTTISTYRDKPGIIEYVAAGGMTGALYKFNLGPRGWIVGGGLGATLGLFCGLSTLAILKMTGMTMEEVRYWQYYWKEQKNDYYKQGMKEYLENKEAAVIKLHNLEVGEKGKNLDNLDANVDKTKTEKK